MATTIGSLYPEVVAQPVTTRQDQGAQIAFKRELQSAANDDRPPPFATTGQFLASRFSDFLEQLAADHVDTQLTVPLVPLFLNASKQSQQAVASILGFSIDIKIPADASGKK